MNDNNEAALVPVKKKTNAELVLELAKTDGNIALVSVLDRMTQLEATAESALVLRKQMGNAIKEVISAARDLEQNYTVPGEKRFKRVVRLRKALDDLEEYIQRKRL